MFQCSTTSEAFIPNNLTKLYEMYVKGEYKGKRCTREHKKTMSLVLLLLM